MTPAARLAQDVCRIGRQAGLDAVGICSAEPFEDARREIESRKERGWSGGMQFTFRNPRRSTDPAATLPGAKSLVVGARGYYRADSPARDTGGAVARYSWVDHYEPLRDALRQVSSRLERDGWRARVVADDNALVDRAAAVRSGIGWYGKNTNVLLNDAGSWFVLGSVVTDAPLTGAPLTDAPLAGEHEPEVHPSGCGSCRRCLTACPTGALSEPYRLDANKCLAWLLQAPGVFPREHRKALGNRIYGCDDCQDACPINKLATRTNPPPPPEPGAQPTVDIIGLLATADDELMKSVGRWYIPGREARYVRRNALIVLGNTGDPADPAVSAALQNALESPDPILRSHAVWAAAALGLRQLIPATDPNDMVSAEIEAAVL